MTQSEDRSTEDLGGTGSPGVLIDPDRTVIDLRDGGPERAVVDLRGPEPLVTFEPAPDEVLERRRTLLVTLAVLNALDLVTTRLVLAAGGTETNPLMAPIIDHPVTPILVKTAGITVLALLLRACPPRSRVVDTGLLWVTIGYMAVVSWNLLILATL